MPSSEVPRIGFDQLPTELHALLDRRVERLGYLGEFFQVCAHQPEALGHFIGFTESLKEALPVELVEVVALTCAVVLGNDYERNQHQRLCLALGLGAEWVAAVEEGAVGDVVVPEPLATCQRYVRLACDPHGVDPSDAFDALCRALDPPMAVGVALTVGRYVAHGVVVRSLGLEPPVPPAVSP